MHVSQPPAAAQISRGFLLKSGSEAQQKESRRLLEAHPDQTLPQILDQLKGERAQFAGLGATLLGATAAGTALFALPPWTFDTGTMLAMVSLGATFLAGAGMVAESFCCHCQRKGLERHAQAALDQSLVDGPKPGTLRDKRFRDEGFLSDLSEVRDKASDQVLERSARVGSVLLHEDARRGVVTVETPEGATTLPGALELPRGDETRLKLRSGPCTQSFSVGGGSWIAVDSPLGPDWAPLEFDVLQRSDGDTTLWADGSLYRRGFRARPLIDATALGRSPSTLPVGELMEPKGDGDWSIRQVGSQDPKPGTMVEVSERCPTGRLHTFDGLPFTLREESGGVNLVSGNRTTPLPAHWSSADRRLEFQHQGMKASQAFESPETGGPLVHKVTLETPAGRVEIRESKGRPLAAELYWGKDPRGPVAVEATNTGYSFRLERTDYRLDPPVSRQVIWGH